MWSARDSTLRSLEKEDTGDWGKGSEPARERRLGCFERRVRRKEGSWGQVTGALMCSVAVWVLAWSCTGCAETGQRTQWYPLSLATKATRPLLKPLISGLRVHTYTHTHTQRNGMDGHIQGNLIITRCVQWAKGIYKKPTEITEKRDYAFSVSLGRFSGCESPRINFYLSCVK